MKLLLSCATIIAFAGFSSGAEVFVLKTGAKIPLGHVRRYYPRAVAANMLDVTKDDIVQADSITLPDGETLKR